MSRIIIRQLIACALFLVGIAWIPFAWHSRLVDHWFAGDAKLQSKLANGVEHWMRGGLDRDHFTTGATPAISLSNHDRSVCALPTLCRASARICSESDWICLV